MEKWSFAFLPMFKLRFPESSIPQWAEKYNYSPAATDATLLADVRPAALERGYLTGDEFRAICKWKTPRSQSKCAKNGEQTVRTITQAAFASPDEALKIDLLRVLDGVEWPTASTLLHFGDARPYPILDYRALWSLGYAKPPHYTTEFWLAYLGYTRGLADRLRVHIRTVDRALWQYSKEKQQ